MAALGDHVNGTQPSTLIGLSESIPLAIFFAIILVLAVIGNGLVIGVIVRHRGMRTRTNMFLFNLAIADFLVGAIVVPFTLTTIIRGHWVFGEVLCQINGFFNALLLMTSIHTLMYISIHKYLSISRPFSKFLTKRKIMIMIAATWLYPMLLAVFTVTGLTSVHYKNGTAQCGPKYPNDMRSYIHHAVTQATITIIPLVIMAYAYIRMYQEIKKHTRRLRDNSTLELDTIIAQQKKVTLTLFIVLACFILCWAPYMIYSMYVTFTKPANIMPLLNIPAYFFGMLNSACNPIIYALRSQPFREGYLEILCRKHTVVTNDDTVDEHTGALTARVTHLWDLLKTSVRSMKTTDSHPFETRQRGWSQCSVAGLGNTTPVTPSKSLTQLMKETPRHRGNSVITKDGATVVMKDGKIVCVRPSVSALGKGSESSRSGCKSSHSKDGVRNSVSVDHTSDSSSNNHYKSFSANDGLDQCGNDGISDGLIGDISCLTITGKLHDEGQDENSAHDIVDVIDQLTQCGDDVFMENSCDSDVNECISDIQVTTC